MLHLPVRAASILVLAAAATATSWAQQALSVKPLAERKVATLPAGDLYWRVETMGTKAEADAAAGPWSLVAESAGKVWLFSLGPRTASTRSAATAAEVGPIPRIAAAEYLLRVNEATGAPGSVTAVHSHPGSEAFYVLKGEQSIRGEHGVLLVKAGQAEAGHGADKAMQVSSTGAEDLHALVMFVVDASRPFSSPAKLP